ncbi:MAG: hypothetical protein JO186_07550 [Actinobacteria bacterium]|nr:hypothetical protein [Actinomycetota bacterium]
MKNLPLKLPQGRRRRELDSLRRDLELQREAIAWLAQRQDDQDALREYLGTALGDRLTRVEARQDGEVAVLRDTKARFEQSTRKLNRELVALVEELAS